GSGSNGSSRTNADSVTEASKDAGLDWVSPAPSSYIPISGPKGTTFAPSLATWVFRESISLPGKGCVGGVGQRPRMAKMRGFPVRPRWQIRLWGCGKPQTITGLSATANFFPKSLAIIDQELHLPPGGASESPRPEHCPVPRP